MKILITGGAGYIGTHTLLDVLHDDHEVLVVDNFANSSQEALDRVKRLSNQRFDHEQASVTDGPSLSRLFQDFKPDAVIHFAGLKAVGESEQKPLAYYEENLFGGLELLKAMDAAGCKRIIFSSSATVYGVPDYLPFDEAHPLGPTNPYGRTKYFLEEVITDWAKTDSEKSAVLLRYFNPVGAHPSGQIGEDPLGIPNNLVPFIAQVAVGRRPKLQIFGNDYDTPDGTGIRDYIHVSDLAKGHVDALNYAANHKGVEAINLGTGTGHSVLDVVKAFEAASGKHIAYEFAPRRPGDVASSYANPEKAKMLLGWQATKSLSDMCEDVWRWQSQNPQGYNEKT
ncbi:MAG: UDP-glucose 4-epimerase GalE [Candidatus Puniceispirillaceae bacterium]